MSKLLIVPFLMIGILSALPQRVAAQANPFTRPEASSDLVDIALVAVTNRQPPLVMRRTGTGEGRNVVLVDPTVVTPAQLSAAVFALLASEMGDPAGRQRDDNMVARVRPTSKTAHYHWAPAAIQQLTSRPAEHVAGLGNRGVVRLWLAPLAADPRR